MVNKENNSDHNNDNNTTTTTTTTTSTNNSIDDDGDIFEIDKILNTNNVKINLNDSINMIAVEAKQFMNLNSCEILLTDLTSYAVRVYKYQYQLMDKSSSLLPSSSSSSLLTPHEMKIELMDKLLPNVIKLLHELSVVNQENTNANTSTATSPDTIIISPPPASTTTSTTPTTTTSFNINNINNIDSTTTTTTSKPIEYINFKKFSQIMQRLLHRLAHTIIP
jgi:hypothetical protein